MIVRRQDFQSVLQKLKSPSQKSLDTETTGLRPYLGDRLFSLIICDESGPYYFNFQKYEGISEEWVLPREWLQEFRPVFEDREQTWGLSNAKFDMHMLWKEELELLGEVHCTEAQGRIIDNSKFKYGLDALVSEIGARKDTSVEEYIKKHKLITKIAVPGKDKPFEHHHYDRVPFDIISPYGCSDSVLTRALMIHQRTTQYNKILDDLKAHKKIKSPPAVFEVDRRLTQTLFRMEREGVKIDRRYCELKIAEIQANKDRIAAEFKQTTNLEFQDSRTVLVKAFTALGEKYPVTKLGNPSFTAEVLDSFHTPVAQLVKRWRQQHKLFSTYFSNFTYFADSNDKIHPNFKQGGTVTGRLSCTEPNLQNLPKPDDDGTDEENEESKMVRRAFIPEDGTCFVMFDYDQMEYKKLADYLGNKILLEAMARGEDFHKVTAEMMGVPRKIAKTINFLLLYRGGPAKLAKALGVSIERATELRNLYFSKIDGIQSFFRKVDHRAESRGVIYNWLGRPLRCTDKKFAYTLLNHLIQGGCADVIKKAMNEIDEFLTPYKTKILLQIHDELILKAYPDEFHLLPRVKEIMENAYESMNGVKLTCGVDHSWESWADKVEGYPNAG